jgi:hypothetical protein
MIKIKRRVVLTNTFFVALAIQDNHKEHFICDNRGEKGAIPVVLVSIRREEKKEYNVVVVVWVVWLCLRG